MTFYWLILLLFVGVGHAANTCDESHQEADFEQALVLCENQFKASGSQASGELILKLINITHEMDLADKKQYYLTRLENHPNFHQSPELQYEWYRWHGMTDFFAGNLKSAEDNFLEALSIAVLSDNPNWLGQIYNALGVLANHHRDFPTALAYYKKSLDINLKTNNDFLAGKAYINMGTVFQMLQDYDAAMAHYQLSLTAFKKYQNRPDHDKEVLKQIKHVNESLLQVNLIVGDDEAAAHHAQMVIENAPEQLIDIEKIPSIVNFARLYINKEQYRLAQYFLDKAFEISEQSNDYFMHEVQFQMAVLSQLQNNMSVAIEQAREALEYTDQNDYVALAKYHQFLSEVTAYDAEESLKYLKMYQYYREQLLAQKYNSDVKTIQHNNEKLHIESALRNEQASRFSSELRIKSLSHHFLAVTVVLLLILVGAWVIMIWQKREKKTLLNQLENTQPETADDNGSQASPIADIPLEKVDKSVFCEYLVTTMNTAVSIWEKNTATNRTELADQSGIWTISNDDGTLRTRSLDKYLSVDKIPKNPRWRNVVRTCHFILSDKKVCQEDKQMLELSVNNIMAYFQKLNTLPSGK